MKKYQVGGFVRDRLLGARSKDLDYVVLAPSYEEMREWVAQQGTIFLEKPEFWTIRAQIPGSLPADFVLARKDGQYSDGRRPDSVSVGTLHDDLSRRDFTVNAIAYDEETDEYIDPFDGQTDIKNRVLRCVGNAYDRFFEDSLRMLRAIRFSLTKGFEILPSITDCFSNQQLLTRLADIKDERKQGELEKCFAYNTIATLRFFSYFPDLMRAVFSGKLWLLPTLKNP